jgi:hypothetical protein
MLSLYNSGGNNKFTNLVTTTNSGSNNNHYEQLRQIQSVHDLRLIHKERNKNDHQIYKTLLHEVFKLIQQKDASGKYNTLYKIPCVVYGNSRYKIATAVNYIIRKLTEGGFVVYPYEGTMLYIDWSIVNMKMPTHVVDNDLNQKPRLPLKPCIKNSNTRHMNSYRSVTE